MTISQLEKGNELRNKIEDMQRSKDKVQNCLTELELSSYKTNMTSLVLDRKDCFVSTDRLVAFLWEELKIVDKLIETSKHELESL